MKGCQLQKRIGTNGLYICRTKTEVLLPEPSANKNKQYPCMIDAGRIQPVSLVVVGGGDFSNVWWLSLIRGFTTVREMKTTPL